MRGRTFVEWLEEGHSLCVAQRRVKQGLVLLLLAFSSPLVSKPPAMDCVHTDGRFVNTGGNGCYDRLARVTWSTPGGGISSADVGFWSRHRARAFCTRLGKGFHLPTEQHLLTLANAGADYYLGAIEGAYYWTVETSTREGEKTLEYQVEGTDIGQYEVEVDSGFGFRTTDRLARRGTANHRLDLRFEVQSWTLVRLSDLDAMDITKHSMVSSSESVRITPEEESPRPSVMNGRLNLLNGPRRVVGPTRGDERRENRDWGMDELPYDFRFLEIGVLCVRRD